MKILIRNCQITRTQKIITKMLDRFRFKPTFFKRQEDSMNRSVAERFKIKTAPSHYPRFLFRSLQVVQLICAITVTVIMFWFIYHLRDSSIAVPWKFIFVSCQLSNALIPIFAKHTKTIP